jgi:hypothetical protein
VKRTPAEILAARAPAQPPAAAPEPTATTNTPDLQSATSTNSDIDTNADALTPSPLSLAPDTNAAAGAEAAQSPPPLPDPQRKLAEEILSKLDAGDSFESMARVYSEGKEAKEGGDWGWIGRDVLRKELNEVAFTLKPGEHSRIIDTAEGYYILHVEDVKPAHVKPLAEVREEIEKNLLQQQRSKMQQEWVKNLRAKAYIRLY